MELPLIQVDAFTRAPLRGNPAAVCVLDDWLDDARMQEIAVEMNLSETAFVIAGALAEGGEAPIRWFTPGAEVDLCGHATLASAHALWSSGRAEAARPIRFRSRVHGVLACTRRPDGAITMDFPRDLPREASPPPGLLEALGVSRARGCWSSGVGYLLELESPDAVARVAPDFGALASVDAPGVGVTARGGASAVTPGARVADFVSRYFAPRFGILEDPVTGSLHCALAPLWAARFGRDELFARQVSRRGGELELALRRDRVEITGHAVTVLRGVLTL
ncbi:MAG: PhzF family phenazine biosynthesis protein [Myxococcales bacterium]|nr:PhzF family phenazine biosynthesis protein [Myxococcales bacterium]